MVFISVLSLLATPINFLVVALILLYMMVLVRDFIIKDKMKNRELAVISGCERTCEELAAAINPAERLELYGSPKQVLEEAVRRNIILVFIVKRKLSSLGEGILKHLQYAYRTGGRYVELRYAIFGIGDTSNKLFNALAMDIDLSLRKVGAKNVVPMRLYDVFTSVAGLCEEYSDFLKQIRPSRPVSPFFVLPESTDDDDLSCSSEEHERREKQDEPVVDVDDNNTPDNEADLRISEQEIVVNDDEADDDWEVMESLGTDHDLSS